MREVGDGQLAGRDVLDLVALADAGSGRVALDIGDGDVNRAPLGVEQAPIACHEAQDRDALGRGGGQVPATDMLAHAVMDTTTPHGELLFSLFGALAQYERALTRERVMAGLAAAKRRGRQGGRPPTIDVEMMEQIKAALDGGASKASVCRSFKVARSTLIGSLERAGWSAPPEA